MIPSLNLIPGLTVKRHSDLVTTRVVDPMESDIIGDIRHVVHGVFLIRCDFQWTMIRLLIRDAVYGLLKCACEDLHDTVGIGVVMDGRTFPGIPDEEELG